MYSSLLIRLDSLRKINAKNLSDKFGVSSYLRKLAQKSKVTEILGVTKWYIKPPKTGGVTAMLRLVTRINRGSVTPEPQCLWAIQAFCYTLHLLRQESLFF